MVQPLHNLHFPVDLLEIPSVQLGLVDDFDGDLKRKLVLLSTGFYGRSLECRDLERDIIDLSTVISCCLWLYLIVCGAICLWGNSWV